MAACCLLRRRHGACLPQSVGETHMMYQRRLRGDGAAWVQDSLGERPTAVAALGGGGKAWAAKGT